MGRWELHAELAVGGEVPAPAIAAALEALKSLGDAQYAQGILAVRIDTQASTAEEARAQAIGRFYDVLDRTVAGAMFGGDARRSGRLSRAVFPR